MTWAYYASLVVSATLALVLMFVNLFIVWFALGPLGAAATTMGP